MLMRDKDDPGAPVAGELSGDQIPDEAFQGTPQAADKEFYPKDSTALQTNEPSGNLPEEEEQKPEAEADQEKAEAEEESQTGEEAGDEAEAEEDSREYTETDALRDAGVEEYETISEYVKATKGVQEMIEEIGKLSGMDLSGRTPEEVARALRAHRAQPADDTSRQEDKQTQKAEPSSFDDVFERHKNTVNLHSVTKDEDGNVVYDGNSMRQFFVDYADAIVTKAVEQLNDSAPAASLNHLGQQTGMATLRALYADAVRSRNGDGHIPPFSAIVAEVQKNPKVMEQAYQEWYTFGNYDKNPLTDMFDDLGKRRDSLGLTAAERTDRKRQAQEAKRFKRQMRAGKTPTRKGPRSSKDMKTDELHDTLHDMPVTVLNR